QVDAIVLAYAGLRRLGLEDRATEVLSVDVMLPAVGQGALGIESRAHDDAVREVLRRTDHTDTRIRVTAERAFMEAVEGNCRLPVAAYAERRTDGQLWLRAMLADGDGEAARFGERVSTWSLDDATRAGRDLGAELRSGG
ncbi:MAG: hydroxymethylbilane synthase, partial [Myxococcota bacterium]